MLDYPKPIDPKPYRWERHLDGIDLAPDVSEELELELRKPPKRIHSC